MSFLSSRTIGVIPVSVVESEQHTSELSITQLPVEAGADITDHAYIQPKTVTIKGYIGNGSGGFRGSFITAAAYQALIRYQESRIPFFLVNRYHRLQGYADTVGFRSTQHRQFEYSGIHSGLQTDQNCRFWFFFNCNRRYRRRSGCVVGCVNSCSGCHSLARQSDSQAW